MSNALDKLTIKGFKSIKSLEDFELTNLNILIGGNGAGKTNFIDFFRLLREMMDGNLNDYIHKSGGISDLLFNGRKFTEQLEFETHFGLRNPPRYQRIGYPYLHISSSFEHRPLKSPGLREPE